jgi:hypothetical protein
MSRKTDEHEVEVTHVVGGQHCATDVRDLLVTLDREAEVQRTKQPERGPDNRSVHPIRHG